MSAENATLLHEQAFDACDRRDVWNTFTCTTFAHAVKRLDGHIKAYAKIQRDLQNAV